MSPSEASEVGSGTQHVAVLGGGLIGRSWTALFLAAGRSVTIYDPDPATERRVKETVDSAWAVLTSLGLVTPHTAELRFCDDPREAVVGADFVQESIPERLRLKRALYASIEPVLGHETIVASSASGLTLSELQQGWQEPDHLILGHPFNPPHLIPLVEVMGNDRTAAGVVDRARAFYESVGKVTIEVKREVPGHVANRLQAALWREAIHLANEGVASVEDIDKAVSSGPGLRWAVMGPTLLFHLGGDDGGLAAFCERYGDSFNRWWDDLGQPHLDAAMTKRLVDGLSASVTSHSVKELALRRDEVLTAVVAATHNGGTSAAVPIRDP